MDRQNISNYKQKRSIDQEEQMKNLTSITLEHNLLKEKFMRSLEIRETQRSEFYLPIADGIGNVSALNFKNDSWEHVLIDLEAQKRCATYEEMCNLKDIFWDENEIAIQVHPAKSDYINFCKYCLHLWRFRDIYSKTETILHRKIQAVYNEAKKYYHQKKEAVLFDYDGKKLAIFGGNSWPTWEEVCKFKQMYWELEETAIQFNISCDFDLNPEHMIILWDAADFYLPPKKLV